MPFDFSSKERIAIIGGGVSGMAAAYELSPHRNVTLFEASTRLGGHARTVMAGAENNIAVDTGFIVFNYPNYPNLTRMFAELEVPVKKSNMNFSASIAGGKIEYGLRSFRALFAQKRNLLRPAFWRMLADIARFNKHALAMSNDPGLSVAGLLKKMKLGRWFRDYYLLPISGAIWSSTPAQIAHYPARSLVRFFENHALLTTNNHLWYTVDGGSIEYVKRMAKAIEGRGGTILTGAPVRAVSRHEAEVTLTTTRGETHSFDQVIFACHSDDALKLIAAPTREESAILSSIRYQDNRAVLHGDESQMPKRKACWSSWVFQSVDDSPAPAIGITYWMNALQGIDAASPLFVTLNPQRKIRPEKIFEETIFRHPIFDRAAVAAQPKLQAIQGENRTWFCGAYARHGFHEDGYASAMMVTEKLRRKVAPK